jgi:phytoene/squalene synthetase
MPQYKEYDDLCLSLSEMITRRYSTSFTKGIQTLHKRFHLPIYGIYGFVRLADEIVDTFHDQDKKKLLLDLKTETYEAIERGLSTNPVLHAFQFIVNKYRIQKDLIEAFLHSMEMDLVDRTYDQNMYEEYIYGSAEVVGLMCLRVFCEGDDKRYNELEQPAKHLGSAFQKVNFLRDMASDFNERGRVYFPGIDFDNFSETQKKEIEADIDKEFRLAYPGIMNLPKDVRPGVYTAFIYYRELLKKIEKASTNDVKQMRIRVPDIEKILLLLRTYTKFGI